MSNIELILGMHRHYCQREPHVPQYVVYATPPGLPGSHRYTVPAPLESAERTAAELRLCGRTDVIIVPVLT